MSFKSSCTSLEQSIGNWCILYQLHNVLHITLREFFHSQLVWMDHDIHYECFFQPCTWENLFEVNLWRKWFTFYQQWFTSAMQFSRWQPCAFFMKFPAVYAAVKPTAYLASHWNSQTSASHLPHNPLLFLTVSSDHKYVSETSTPFVIAKTPSYDLPATYGYRA